MLMRAQRRARERPTFLPSVQEGEEGLARRLNAAVHNHRRTRGRECLIAAHQAGIVLSTVQEMVTINVTRSRPGCQLGTDLASARSSESSMSTVP
jgi:hypothetical protein